MLVLSMPSGRGTRFGASRLFGLPTALVLTAAISSAACGPRTSVAPLPPGPPSSAVAKAPPPIPHHYPPPIAAPREVACTLTAPVWPIENTEEGGGIHYLRFAPGRPPFAQLYLGTDVELLIPAALPTAGGYLRIDAGGVHLEAQVEAAELPLYAASPLVLGGVFIPNNETRLVWRSARAGAITVSADAGPRVRPRGDRLNTELPCAKIAVRDAWFEAEAIDLLMKAPKSTALEAKPSTLWLQPGRIPLSAAPDGDAIVDIDVVEPPDDRVLIHPLRLLGKEKGWSRVALVPFGGVLFGWVRDDALRHRTKEYLDLSHDVVSYVIKKTRQGSFVRCDHDVPLVAEAGGERRLVGFVRARTPFEPLGAKAEWTIVDFPKSALAPAKDASLLLETSKLASCTPDGRQRPGSSPVKAGAPKVDAFMPNWFSTDRCGDRRIQRRIWIDRTICSNSALEASSPFCGADMPMMKM